MSFTIILNVYKINYLYSLTALLHWLPFLCSYNVCLLQHVNKQSRQVYNVCHLWTNFIWWEVSEHSLKRKWHKEHVNLRSAFFSILILVWPVTTHLSFLTHYPTLLPLSAQDISLWELLSPWVTSVGTMKVFMSFHIRFVCAQQPTPITFPSLPLGVANFMTGQFFFRVKCKTAYITFIHQSRSMA